MDKIEKDDPVRERDSGDSGDGPSEGIKPDPPTPVPVVLLQLHWADYLVFMSIGLGLAGIVISIILGIEWHSVRAEEGIIAAYHTVVLSVVASTSFVTIMAIIRFPPIMERVNQGTVKLLVGALIVELIGAFVTTYQILPELKAERALRFTWSLEYRDFAPNPAAGDAACLRVANELKSVECLTTIQRVADKDLLTTSERQCLELFQQDGKRKAADISHEYVTSCRNAACAHLRAVGASGRKAIDGELWMSGGGHLYKGIARITIPGDDQATAMTVEGVNYGGGIKLVFTQDPSLYVSGPDSMVCHRPAARWAVDAVLHRGGSGGLRGGTDGGVATSSRAPVTTQGEAGVNNVYSGTAVHSKTGSEVGTFTMRSVL